MLYTIRILEHTSDDSHYESEILALAHSTEEKDIIVDFLDRTMREDINELEEEDDLVIDRGLKTPLEISYNDVNDYSELYVYAERVVDTIDRDFVKNYIVKEDTKKIDKEIEDAQNILDKLKEKRNKLKVDIMSM